MTTNPYNGFSNTINPVMFTPNNQAQPIRVNNGINWVQGIEGAKAWQLMPNSNILLMDSENDGIFYIKTSDDIGMCNLRTFEYTEVTNKSTPSSINPDDYVKKSELQSLLNEMLGGKTNE